MIASGLEPESGTLRIYNWNGYMWPRTKKDFAKEYGVKVEETFFDTMDEAIAEDLVRRGRLRRLLPDSGSHEPTGQSWQGAPAAEPRLPRQPCERLALGSGPLVRQGLAVHGAVRHLDDGNWLSHRQDLVDT